MANINDIFKDKKRLAKCIVTVLVSVMLLFLYLRLTYHLVMRTDLDSDYSNLILEANDILKGNVFLTGWNQTGVSFILTDLLYFIAGVLFFGVSKMAYFAAMVLMIVCTMITTFFLTDFKSIKNNVLFFALTVFPTVNVVCLLRAHTGGYIWTFVILIIVSQCIKHQRITWKSGTAIVLLTAMCAMSDAASLVFGTFSIIIVCVYKIVFDQDASKKFYGILLAVSAGGTVLGFVMDKLYYLIGGANKNGFLAMKSFRPVDEILDNLYAYINAVFILGNADFFGKPIFDLDTIIACAYVPFVIAGLCLVVKNIRLFLLNRNDDIVSIVISIGFAMLSFVFVFTSVGIDIFSSRYFATLPFFFAVLLCRYIQRTHAFDKTIHSSTIKCKYVLMIASIVLIIGGYTEANRSTSKGEYILEQEFFSTYLAAHGLTNGYANYWDASIVTVASKGRVHLSQVEMHDQAIYQQNWFCKNDWYEEPATFVAVYDPEKDDYGVTPQNTYLALGDPCEILTYGGYFIYKYDYDISTKVVKLKDIEK